MKHPKRSKTKGISLLEVMIALAIIALIVGLTAPRLMSSFGRAKSQAAEIQMTNIQGALRLFYVDVGRYPNEAEGLAALLSEPAGTTNWRGPYLDEASDVNDPWDRMFIYRQPGVEAPFDLETLGRDGQPGGTREDSDIKL